MKTREEIITRIDELNKAYEKVKSTKQQNSIINWVNALRWVIESDGE